MGARIEVGDEAMYRHTRVKVVDRLMTDTPTGGTVEVILIERPRAGRKWVLSGEVRALGEEVEKQEVASPETFR